MNIITGVSLFLFAVLFGGSAIVYLGTLTSGDVSIAQVVGLLLAIVWAHSVFDQGTVNQGVLADGTKHSYPGFNRPSSILVTEAFLIENGKIRRVEMIGPSAPYHLNSPWPGGLSGN